MGEHLNSIDEMFEAYKSDFRGTYIMLDADSVEKQAFANGIIAALVMLNINPEDVHSELTGRTVEDDLNDVLISREDAQ